MVPRAHPSHHRKRHLDRFNRFCTGPKYYAVQCIVNGEENPQNCPFLLDFRHPAVEEGLSHGGLSHGHRQHAQKIGKDRACGSGDMLADRQTDTHTHTHMHTQTCSLQYFATAPVVEVKNHT